MPNPGPHERLKFSSVPRLLTFAKEPAAPRGECQNRDTRAVDLAFAQWFPEIGGRMPNPGPHERLKFSSVPRLLTFAKSPPHRDANGRTGTLGWHAPPPMVCCSDKRQGAAESHRSPHPMTLQNQPGAKARIAPAGLVFLAITS